MPMPEIHVIQWSVAFVVASWLTARWLLDRPQSRWRHIVAGIVSTLLWIPVAYTAGNVGVADGGERVAFGSQALGTVATFMIVVCLLALLVGLVLWVEEEAENASAGVPADMRPGRGD